MPGAGGDLAGGVFAVPLAEADRRANPACLPAGYAVGDVARGVAAVPRRADLADHDSALVPVGPPLLQAFDRHVARGKLFGSAAAAPDDFDQVVAVPHRR